MPADALIHDRAPVVTVSCDAPAVRRSGLPKFSVGSDRAFIFLRDEHQRDLLDLQKSLGFRYLRCHGIFNEEMKIVTRRPDGTLAFDWTLVDRFLDQLRRARLRPFVELGFMPEPLASGSQTIFWWKGNVTPPQKQEEWAQLVTAFLRHVLARFGRGEVRKWFFEVWNEPNLDGFWTGGMEGYFTLYRTTAEALKKVDSRLKVGGPGTAGMGWIPEFLGFCQGSGTPVDFVATHSYGAMEGFLDEHGRSRTMLDRRPGALHDEFVRSRKDIRESAFPDLPLFITEWGPSYSPRDPIHDSYVCAPLILEKLRGAEGLTDGMSYWAFSDQFEEPGPPGAPFHGGFGLLNVDGLKKPAFWAYQLLARLDADEVPSTSPRRVIATRKGSRIKVLTWDYSPPEQDKPNDPFYHEDLRPDPLPDLRVVLTGLKPGTYSVSRVGVGHGRGDVYEAYAAMGRPQGEGGHLSAPVLERLRKASTVWPKKQPDVVVGGDGKAVITLPMRTNDVWMLTVEPRP